MEMDGVDKIINVGYSRQSSEISVDLANSYKNIYCSVGIHPHDSKDATQADYEYFISVSQNPKLVAIGEIGLDYYYNLSDESIQKRVFVEQLELANSLSLPIIIHLRDAYADMFTLLSQNKHYLNHGVVLHCYSGTSDDLKQYQSITDMYVSVGGAITFKNNASRKDVIAQVPINLLLLETDCPYMTPVPHRGTINYPKYVKFVASKLIDWFPDRDIITETNNNAKRLFDKLRN
jgi:TatD DNase family protein